MKALRLTPLKHDIELSAQSIEDGVALVDYRLGKNNANQEVFLLASEAECIGAWFLGLAREIQRKDKSSK